MKQINLQKMKSLEVLGLFANIIEELVRRGLTRSKNNPVADYTEHIVCKALALTLAKKVTKGFDATDSEGGKYEIKSRRRSAGSNPTRFSAIRDLKKRHFDFLVAVLLSQDFTVERAAVIPYATVLDLAFHQKHVNAWILTIQDNIWSSDGVVDITTDLRRIQQEEN